MKKFLMAIGFAALLSVVPASAQSSSSMRFDIPFAFVAGNHVLPAGAYRVTVDGNFNTARFDGIGEQTIGMVRLVPGASVRPYADAQPGSARFSKVGEQYVLTGLWRAGALDGNEVINSRKLVESAKTDRPAEVVTVAANLR